eukprot:CAMPEP_0201488828 /NCGR_PEP_ID=MMETSP0151_2-20130828/19660_1 /ASSEMBLY_ACC=CAM_ASM_000257 /TAXON_ID=200890 /ORGANISM="Paramoeba atlantica, Strain 621/1 / CCAP 1560/9" /LENGTH=379 /DNA_ID=CAMNT_0047874201 /DNA_START=76 /DNA_END=1212 /DNA_ORIENTATION=+
MAAENQKPRVLLTSTVFHELADHPLVPEKESKQIKELFEELRKVTDLTIIDERFPSSEKIFQITKEKQIDFIGCHLSHIISQEITQLPSVKGICTSTAGFNHINLEPGVIIGNTPSDQCHMDKTVATYTFALILSNMRNILGLNNYVNSGKWTPSDKWDMDGMLSSDIDHKTVGLIGLGAIGREVLRRLGAWNVNVQYFDIRQDHDLEKQYPYLTYVSDIDEIFEKADIISLHVPLTKQTEGFVNREKLLKMKKGALLVNTSRGPVVNFDDLIEVLQKNEATIHLAFDVFQPEPLSPEHLEAFSSLTKSRPELRFNFAPHNASASADTRGIMDIILLQDLLKLSLSAKAEDLEGFRFIPPQKSLLADASALSSSRIFDW